MKLPLSVTESNHYYGLLVIWGNSFSHYQILLSIFSQWSNDVLHHQATKVQNLHQVLLQIKNSSRFVYGTVNVPAKFKESYKVYAVPLVLIQLQNPWWLICYTNVNLTWNGITSKCGKKKGLKLSGAKERILRGGCRWRLRREDRVQEKSLQVAVGAAALPWNFASLEG